MFLLCETYLVKTFPFSCRDPFTAGLRKSVRLVPDPQHSAPVRPTAVHGVDRRGRLIGEGQVFRSQVASRLANAFDCPKGLSLHLERKNVPLFVAAWYCAVRLPWSGAILAAPMPSIESRRASPGPNSQFTIQHHSSVSHRVSGGCKACQCR